jgi:hypothetical protein
VDKQKSIAYSQCVFVALGIQHAMRGRGSVKYGLSGSISNLTTGTIFIGEGGVTSHTMFLLSLHFLSEAFLIHRRNELDGKKNLYWFSCKVSVTLVRFY